MKVSELWDYKYATMIHQVVITGHYRRLYERRTNVDRTKASRCDEDGRGATVWCLHELNTKRFENLCAAVPTLI